MSRSVAPAIGIAVTDGQAARVLLLMRRPVCHRVSNLPMIRTFRYTPTFEGIGGHFDIDTVLVVASNMDQKWSLQRINHGFNVI